VVGRVIVGLGIGISAVVVPSYLGEVAPAKGVCEGLWKRAHCPKTCGAE
jgi:MFS family permease